MAKTALPAKRRFERMARVFLRDVLFCGLGFFSLCRGRKKQNKFPPSLHLPNLKRVYLNIIVCLLKYSEFQSLIFDTLAYKLVDKSAFNELLFFNKCRNSSLKN